jgi:Putative Flp pilus-assembly TadE/G-like/von Willebrand factor type A domain
MYWVKCATIVEREGKVPTNGCSPSIMQRFASNTDGNVAIIFAFTTLIVVTMVGGAVDYGRWLSARNHTQAAIDSAILAAGRIAQTSTGSASQAATDGVKAARAYYDQMKAKNIVEDTISFEATKSSTSFIAKGTAYIPTPFLSLVSIEKLPVLATTGATQAESSFAQDGNTGTSIEIGLMLDTTGSMCNKSGGSYLSPCTAATKLDALKTAAKDLVDIVVWTDQSKYQSRVAIAPFADTVNVGDYFTAVTGQDPVKSTTYTYPSSCYNSSGVLKSSCAGQSKYLTNQAKAKCVTERKVSAEFTDAAPVAGARITSWYDALVQRYKSELGYSDADAAAAAGSSTWANCSESVKIQPLTSDKNVLKTTINSLIGDGGTGGALGTAWAWYMISPEWGSVFTGANQPESYSKITELGPTGLPKLQKIAVLMTDGEYNIWQYANATTSTVNGKSKSLCSNMKAKGIIVYTVGFEIGNSTSAKDVLSNCATSAEHFYDAKDSDELKSAFRDIALKITKLRLTQ